MVLPCRIVIAFKIIKKEENPAFSNSNNNIIFFLKQVALIPHHILTLIAKMRIKIRTQTTNRLFSPSARLDVRMTRDVHTLPSSTPHICVKCTTGLIPPFGMTLAPTVSQEERQSHANYNPRKKQLFMLKVFHFYFHYNIYFFFKYSYFASLNIQLKKKI